MTRKIRSQLFITLIPAFVVLFLVIAVSVAIKLDFSAFTRDTASIAGIHPLAGFLSNLGILLWSASFFISLFTALALHNSLTKNDFQFLITSAFISGYLLFDDLFMFHEFLAPEYLGVNENVVLFILVLAVVAYLFVHKREILKTDLRMLILALTLLAFSVFVDAAYSRLPNIQLGQWKYLMEDGLKWLGIVCWCSYHVQTAHQFIKERWGSGKSDFETKPSE